jgi:hypothetical protein
MEGRGSPCDADYALGLARELAPPPPLMRWVAISPLTHWKHACIF